MVVLFPLIPACRWQGSNNLNPRIRGFSTWHWYYKYSLQSRWTVTIENSQLVEFQQMSNLCHSKYNKIFSLTWAWFSLSSFYFCLFRSRWAAILNVIEFKTIWIECSKFIENQKRHGRSKSRTRVALYSMYELLRTSPVLHNSIHNSMPPSPQT